MSEQQYLIVPYWASDEDIEYCEKHYHGYYKCIRAENIYPIDKKPKLHWKENLKRQGIRT